MVAANGLIDAAEASHNPCVLSQALLAYGYAFRDADAGRALEALRRGLVIAQESGNRFWEPSSRSSTPRPNGSTGSITDGSTSRGGDIPPAELEDAYYRQTQPRHPVGSSEPK
jgi:hypothetical protein